ncbi:hypothetical protein KPSA1_03869 [Pseudomonas syringae pv. actinidiae]|uniref:Uncharacterized protein n=1 Tax=Pseudomonas syringae pv. actinidiae TaxID=103796 RepID=A0A2V0QC18_PSESF|nr:hypothetical protein KPSA1_03869 [Pseudomonas syringae pv. actinidiae]
MRIGRKGLLCFGWSVLFKLSKTCPQMPLGPRTWRFNWPPSRLAAGKLGLRCSGRCLTFAVHGRFNRWPSR